MLECSFPLDAKSMVSAADRNHRPPSLMNQLESCRTYTLSPSLSQPNFGLRLETLTYTRARVSRRQAPMHAAPARSSKTAATRNRNALSQRV
jgi:hypothetical protein